MGERPEKERRTITLYDAVAGRVTANGFLPTDNSKDHLTDRKRLVIPPEQFIQSHQTGKKAINPEETYFRDRELDPIKQRLPDSDLLKMIHAYAADYYAEATDDHGKTDERSLDETALIAFGILLEEAANAIVGETGHLALTEQG